MRKKVMLLAMVLGLVLSAAVALAMETVEDPQTCQHCPMSRAKFAHSRMLVEYADGTRVGTCSLSCAAVEMRDVGSRQVRALWVADYETKQLIDAGTAVWVAGGKLKGVMTFLPKWAFADETAARAFIQQQGGEVVTFESALKLATEEVQSRQK